MDSKSNFWWFWKINQPNRMLKMDFFSNHWIVNYISGGKMPIEIAKEPLPHRFCMETEEEFILT